jgi:transcriptional regulator with XRE-family HTH domain
MAKGIDRHTLGQRVAYWRVQRHLTQQELADRLGRPRNWIWKIESGAVGSLERYSTLAQVADALTVDMQVLLGRDLDRPVQGTECADPEAVEAIRTALERYDTLTGPLDPAAAPEPPALEKLGRQADYVWTAFDLGRYGVVSSALPRLLSDAQLAHTTYTGDDAATAASLLAQAYQLGASVLRKLGEHQLGWFAADRAIRIVNETGDLCWHGVASFRIGNALLAMGRVEAALQVQLGAVNRLSPDHAADDTDDRMSVYGIVLLQAAMAAARKGDSATVTDLLTEAGAVARRVGVDAMHYRSTFGPTNLGVHRTAAAVEMGEGALAVHAHEEITPAALAALPSERRANHLLDVARGYAQWGKPDQAAEFLVAADALCPAEVRCRPVAQSVLRELSRRRKTENLPKPLRDLAAAVEMPS